MAKGDWWDVSAYMRRDAKFVPQKATRKLMLKSGEEITEIYRYFDEEQHAIDLMQGKLYVSTLESCRGYEDPKRGDKDEGHQTYNTGIIQGHGSDKEFVAAAAKANFTIGPLSRDTKIINCTQKTVLRDAYVLCTTLGFATECLTNNFGKYCVKISNINDFHYLATRALWLRANVIEDVCGEVIYREQYFQGGEESPGPLGFVKSPDKYSDQREFRFLWTVPDGLKIKPMILEIDEITPMLTRVV